MNKIAILVDSTCGIPESYLSQYPIKVARLKVVYPEAYYTDGIDITPTEIYQRLPHELPTTSMPTVEDLCQIYDELISESYTHVIGLPISSGLSGTINSFHIASKQYATQITSCIYDFKHLSMAIGLSVLEIAKEITEGASFEALCDKLSVLQTQTHMFFTVETLEYLIKGGRIGKVSGCIGEFLNLKPIITMDSEGGYITHSKSRGFKQALRKLETLALSYLEQSPCKIAIMTGTLTTEAEYLREKLSSHPHATSIYIGEITPVVGIHSGPELLAVAILNQ